MLTPVAITLMLLGPSAHAGGWELGLGTRDSLTETGRLEGARLSVRQVLAAHARLAHLELGECGRALPSYRAIAAEGDKRWRSWAQEGLEDCQR